EQHCGSVLLVQLADDAEDLRDDEWREPERRLVEQQEPRALHDRACEREHLLLAAGQRSGLLVAASLEPREELADALEVRLQRAAPHVCAEAQVLPDRELRERPAPFGNVRDAEARGR